MMHYLPVKLSSWANLSPTLLSLYSYLKASQVHTGATVERTVGPFPSLTHPLLLPLGSWESPCCLRTGFTAVNVELWQSPHWGRGVSLSWPQWAIKQLFPSLVKLPMHSPKSSPPGSTLLFQNPTPLLFQKRSPSNLGDWGKTRHWSCKKQKESKMFPLAVAACWTPGMLRLFQLCALFFTHTLFKRTNSALGASL